MHNRFGRAYVSAPQATTRPPQQPRTSATRTLWALRPWKSPVGRLVAVRLKDGRLEVGVAGSPLRWVPAEVALSSSDAEKWALIGFKP